MNKSEIWNKIVKIFKENYYSEEYKLQDLWLKIFEQYFHYNSLDDEICTKKLIHLGSTNRLIPDIILKKDNKDYAIVELKTQNFNSCEKFRLQLFSYLKQLKVSIGVLITNKIELFVYDYSKDDNEQQSIEIDFNTNNSLGEEFVDLFEKSNIDIEKIKNFINNNCENEYIFEKLSNKTNEKLIKDVLLSYYLSQGYNESAIQNFLNKTKIDVRHITTEVVPPKPGPGPTPLPKPEAIRICKKNNVSLSDCITFASLDSEFGKYRANTNLKYLRHNWTILLNDGFHKKLHILKIPANAFTQNDFYIRRDKNLIVLHIDKNFEDCQ